MQQNKLCFLLTGILCVNHISSFCFPNKLGEAQKETESV